MPATGSALDADRTPRPRRPSAPRAQADSPARRAPVAGRWTLETGVLVNETFIKLLQQRKQWKNREHFFAIATRAMVRVLLDLSPGASRRNKRGGGVVRVSLEALGLKEAIPPVACYSRSGRRLRSLDAADPRAGARRAAATSSGAWTTTRSPRCSAVSRSTVDRDWRVCGRLDQGAGLRSGRCLPARLIPLSLREC